MSYKAKFLTPAEGGLGAATVATTGKVPIGNGTVWVTSTAGFPTSSGAAGTILRSDGTNWAATTTTYPNTNAISTLLYASAANVMSALATGNNGILVTGNTGVPSILAGPGVAGKVLQSNTSSAPSYSTATYPSVATSTGTLMRANGTNWVPTTATYPNVGGTASTLMRSDGTNWVNTSAFQVSATDIMTNTAQPMVSASQATSQVNATGDGTSFDVIFDQIINQNGSNYSTVTGKYTCPVSGFYQISYSVAFTGITVLMNDGYHQILSSAGTILRSTWNAAAIQTAGNEVTCNNAIISRFSAGDTIYINVNIGNGTKVASTKQNFFGNFCYFSVQLVG